MTPLKLIAFPGAPNLPFFAGAELGCFRRQGIDLELETTPSSMRQAEALAAGACRIVATALDNVVAYSVGQGEVPVPGTPDFVVFAGASRIELSLVAQAEIAEIADLRGRRLAMDALSTGFAFVLYAMLEEAGVRLDEVDLISVGATPGRLQALRDRSAAATLLIEPFTSLALAEGHRRLARSAETFAHYQGGVFAAGRAWAAANPGLVTGFCRAYLEALAWCRDPANRERARALLAARMPEIGAARAAGVLERVLDPATGLIPGAALDMAGVDCVLELRRRYGPDAAAIGPAADHIDLSYLEAAKG